MISFARRLTVTAIRSQCLLAMLLVQAAAAGASEELVAGTYYLYPNLPAQSITLLLSGGQNIEGVDLFAQVADGGPGVGGSIVGPSITGSLSNPGLIFANNNSGVIDGNPGAEYGNEIVILSTTTEAGTIVGSGPLATLRIDTEGFSSGTFALNLAGTAAGDSDLGAPRDAAIVNGSILIPDVPGIIPGDVNLDGVVNGLDISVMASHWLQTGSNVPGDTNGDGVVNGLDISAVAAHWLQSLQGFANSAGGAAGIAAVPEPTTASLGVLAAAALTAVLARARRGRRESRRIGRQQ
jgi:hypothetical protein